MSKITTDKYSVEYFESDNTVSLTGDLALDGPSDYAPILAILQEAADKSTSSLNLNLKELAFLNSSGISMISKYVIGFRNKKSVQLTVTGSEAISWQSKSLKNLEKLLPGLKLVLQ